MNACRAQRITEDEFFQFLEKRKGLLDGVCVSGGEPLIQKGISGFISKIKALGFLVKLDTNGSAYLGLKELVEHGLVDYVAMDIKNSPAKYAVTAGTAEDILPEINKSVAFLLSDPVEYEFRTTVVKDYHTKEDFKAIGQWIRGAKKYYFQNFTNSGDVIRPGLCPVEKKELEEFAAIVRNYVPSVQIRGE
ncbi:7-carboxy-7-deazaguanine synthase [bioreactor metagenome]|uniref:7-carboxy-7-deazaguanine synthase n=1 Tax=bioreactor metagenome TaxID=1076179 RepID=A0A644VP84_9ZZZZ